MKKVLLSIGIAIVLMAQTGIASALVFSDNFNASTLDTFWWTPSAGNGNTVSHVNNRIEMTQGSSAVDSDLIFNFLINGDFTADVDYSLINWPANNGERLGIRIDAGAVERVSDNNFGGESYLTDIFGNIIYTPTSDTSGSLRLTRVGNVFTGYYWSGSDWTTINAYDFGSAPDTNLALSIWPATSPTHVTQGVQVAFDNFSLNAPDMANPVPEPTTLLLLSSGLIGLAGFRRKKLKM